MATSAFHQNLGQTETAGGSTTAASQYAKPSEMSCEMRMMRMFNSKIPILISTTGPPGQCTAVLVVELGMLRDPLLPSCPKGSWVLEDPPWHHSTLDIYGDTQASVTYNSDIAAMPSSQNRPSPGSSSQSLSVIC